MTPSPPRAELDAARALVAQRDLTAVAAGALSENVRRLPVEALTPVKQLLKRFFSDQPWDEGDDTALAELFGSGPGSVSTSERPALDAELTLAATLRPRRRTAPTTPSSAVRLRAISV